MPQKPHIERHFTASETVRDVVIGMSDGLTVPFALAAGLSGALGSTRVVVVAGLAEIAAGAIAMGESYLLLTRSGDPGSRARSRKAMIAGGWSYGLAGSFQGMVYTAMQEAATRTFYLCAARACGDEQPPLGAALRLIAKDETLHMAFYRDVVKVHLDKDPDYLRPLAGVMVRFEMPWAASVLRDFEERRAYLAAQGVFRLSDYLDEVVDPLSSYRGLDRCVSQSEETRKAHAQLRRYRAGLRKVARREVRPAEHVDARPAES